MNRFANAANKQMSLRNLAVAVHSLDARCSGRRAMGQTKAAMLDQLLETGSSSLSCVEGHMLGDVGRMKDPYLTNGSCIARRRQQKHREGGNTPRLGSCVSASAEQSNDLTGRYEVQHPRGLPAFSSLYRLLSGLYEVLSSHTPFCVPVEASITFLIQISIRSFAWPTLFHDLPLPDGPS